MLAIFISHPRILTVHQHFTREDAGANTMDHIF